MRPRQNKLFAIAAVVLVALVAPLMLAGCSANKENVLFGTDYSLELTGGGAMSKAARIDKALVALEASISTVDTASDVYKINAAPINTPIAVGKDFATLYAASLTIHEKYPSFSPFIFPLVELWKFDPTGYVRNPSQIPSASQIEDVLLLCRADSFYFDQAALTITKLREGAKLDFGAIGKGYAADVAATVAEDTKYVINIGGTIRTNKKIRVSITSPRGVGYAAAFYLDNAAVATSGDYERYYIVDGTRYHHIIGGNGYPAGLGEAEPIISATVVGAEAAMCDVLSTLIFIEGERCAELVISMGYSALILTETTYKIIGDTTFEIIEQRVEA